MKKKKCLICGLDDAGALRDVNLTPHASTSLLYPFFPIITLPPSLFVCDDCGGVLREVDKGGRKIQEIVKKCSLHQHKFLKGEETLRELREKIMFPCNFGEHSSTFRFTNEDVAGDFGKLPNELLDKVFGYLDPSSILNIRQVSSFMRNKSFPHFQLNCPIDLMKWMGNDYFFSWPHLKGHGTLDLNIRGPAMEPLMEQRLKELFLEGKEAVKKVKLRLGVGPAISARIMKEMLESYNNLEELDLDISMEVTNIFEEMEYLPNPDPQGEGDVISWTWGPPIASLKKVTFRSPIPKLKKFMQTTPSVSMVMVAVIGRYSELLFKLNQDDSLWPLLKGISIPNHFNLHEVMEALGSRPIKHLSGLEVDYPNLGIFVEILEKFADTLEWVDITIRIYPPPRYPLRLPPLAPLQYVEMDLPTNLKRLTGLKIIIKEKIRFNRPFHEAQEIIPWQCGYCMTSNGQSELQRKRDFFKIGHLLKDPLLFREKFPRLRNLFMGISLPDYGVQSCHNCIIRRHSIGDSLVPPEAFNPDLRLVELSQLVPREDPTLYAVWRERLARAFPNAKIKEPPMIDFDPLLLLR